MSPLEFREESTPFWLLVNLQTITKNASSSTKSLSLPLPVFVRVPLKFGKKIGDSTYNSLTSNEKSGPSEAAEAIYQTFKTTMQN